MNGATADPESATRIPIKANTNKMGISHHFLFSLRNRKNSLCKGSTGSSLSSSRDLSGLVIDERLYRMVTGWDLDFTTETRRARSKAEKSGGQPNREKPS